MSRMSNHIFMMKNIDQIRPSRLFMKGMDKIKSQLQRCKVLKVINTFESIFNWQIMTGEHVEK